MKSSILTKNEIAECVGLWLAEGDNKTKYEITFTNNCWELIELFFTRILELFKGYRFNPRIYVYSPDEHCYPLFCPGFVIKNYIDKRATRTYFIFRIASVELVKIWKKLVDDYTYYGKYSSDILRGFFAGEGNLKSSSHNSKMIRIAQKEPKPFVD